MHMHVTYRKSKNYQQKKVNKEALRQVDEEALAGFKREQVKIFIMYNNRFANL